jgi:hypothetical protein
MNYYVLSQNNITINIIPTFIKSKNLTPYISQSLIYYLNKANENLTMISNTCNCNCNDNDNINIDIINKIVNTYEFIFTNVPDSILSVSKVKPDSNIFYELLELFSICNIQEHLVSKNKIVSLHLTPNFHSSIYLLNIIRNNKEDMYYGDIINTYQNLNPLLNYDFLFFEFKKSDYMDNKLYFQNMINVLEIIIKHQENNGVTVIKVDNIFHKVLIDCIYILSVFFDKIYIIKPQVSNIITSDRYIVCKQFNHYNNLQKIQIQIQLQELVKQLSKLSSDIIISSLLETSISYYFVNKIEESNIIIGQQQLETLDQIINIKKNKNKEEKIETLKRNHIQKCILWCEKYKIPYNKFIDKTNIFLNSKIAKDTNIQYNDVPYTTMKELSLLEENIYDK